MKSELKIILIIAVILLGTFVFLIFRPDAYLPHQKIIISVPFEKTDLPINLIPMGETINHPKPQVPNGHPGIDFQWHHNSNILSSSDGQVSSIKLGSSNPGKWDVEVRSGLYLLRYKELEDYNSDLKIGSKVKKDDLIGHPGAYNFPDHPGTEYQIHWELASISLVLDRWCPMIYFDEESRKIMEKIWENVSADDKIKKQFPYICSGDYYKKEEKV